MWRGLGASGAAEDARECTQVSVLVVVLIPGVMMVMCRVTPGGSVHVARKCIHRWGCKTIRLECMCIEDMDE